MVKEHLEALATALKNNEVSKEDAWRIADRFEKQARIAEAVVFKRFVWITIVWVVAFGVAKGVIKEGNIVTFSMTQLSAALLIAPIMISLFYHDAVHAILLGHAFSGSLVRCIGYAYKGLSEEELESLFPSVNFAEAETFLLGFPLFKITAQLASIMMGIAPLAALGHSAYLLIAANVFPLSVALLCIVVATLIGLRALGILYFVFAE